jgi:hypothetical protein
MTQTLSIQTLSPSERAHLGSQYNADDQMQLVQNAGNYASLSSTTPWQRVHSLPVNVPAHMSWLTDVPGVTVIGQQQIVHPEPRPTYRGRVSGPVRTLISIFDRWQLDSGDAALFLGSDTSDFINDLRVGTSGLNTRDIKDRARILIKIYEGVHSLMRDPEAERSWIRAPLAGLNGRAILEVMRGGSISDLIYVSQFIDHVNAR